MTTYTHTYAPRRRRWPYYAGAVTLLVATGIVGWLLMTGGQQQSAAASDTPADIHLSITATTSDGLIGQNHDDETCVFRELEWVVRDEAGTIIGSGRHEDERWSAGDAQWAVAGDISNPGDPLSYECRTAWIIDVPAAEIYEVQLSSTGVFGSDHSGQAIGDGSNAITVEIN